MIIDNNNYFSKRDTNNIKRIEAIIEELPPFCREFFIGISNTTTTLTQLNYAYDLRIFFNFLIKKIIKKDIKSITLADIENISASDIEYFLSYLNNYESNDRILNDKESGKARKLATLRSFFRYYFNKDKIKVNITTKVSMPKIHDKEIVRLEINEIVDILDLAESGNALTEHQKVYHKKTQFRDVAILTLFLGTGIRISELVGMNIEDIDFGINGFKITRKGGNISILYFSEEVSIALSNYILNYRNIILKNESNEKALFLSLQGNRLSNRAIQNLVQKYSKIITPLKKISPHKLRSTFGTNLYKETNDIYIVADVLGHKDVNTTKKHYAAISDDLRRNVSKKVILRDSNKKD